MRVHPVKGDQHGHDGPGAAGASQFHVALREATRADHDVVDGLFGRFDLGDARSYGDFLTAQARALLAVEAWLGGAGRGADAPVDGEGRSDALREDLAGLGRDTPEPLPVTMRDEEAARWGAAYVIEGSRLGGAVLRRSVGPGMPAAFLSARHAPGAWRSFLNALEQRAQAGGADWRARALESARQTFAMFAGAARMTAAR